MPQDLLEDGERIRRAGAERALAQEVDVPDDDVQGRPELVRDVREELGLQALRDVELRELVVGLERDVDPEEQPLGAVALVVIALDGETPQHLAWRLLAGVAGLQDDLHEGIALAHAGDQLLAVHDRHEVVDEEELRRLAREEVEGLRAAFRREHAMALALEEEADGGQRLDLVVDDHDRSSARLRLSSRLHRSRLDSSSASPHHGSRDRDALVAVVRARRRGERERHEGDERECHEPPHGHLLPVRSDVGRNALGADRMSARSGPPHGEWRAKTFRRLTSPPARAERHADRIQRHRCHAPRAAYGTRRARSGWRRRDRAAHRRAAPRLDKPHSPRYLRRSCVTSRRAS